eukprot:568853-Rhodomonas_salina.2
MLRLEISKPNACRVTRPWGSSMKAERWNTLPKATACIMDPCTHRRSACQNGKVGRWGRYLAAYLADREKRGLSNE